MPLGSRSSSGCGASPRAGTSFLIALRPVGIDGEDLRQEKRARRHLASLLCGSLPGLRWRWADYAVPAAPYWGPQVGSLRRLSSSSGGFEKRSGPRRVNSCSGRASITNAWNAFSKRQLAG
jgi:hypothetical protein